MSESVTIGQLVDAGVLVIGDGYRAKNDELTGGGPIFLRAGEVSDAGFDFEHSERFGIEFTDKVRPKMGRPEDTVVTTKGNSVGRVAFVPIDAPEFVYSPHLSYWRSLDRSQVNPRYLYFWSRSPEFANQLAQMAHGTDMAPYLSLRDQLRISITLPEASVQSGIAQVLGSLDDKIAVNEQISGTCAQILDAAYLGITLASNGSEARRLGEIVNFRYGKALPAKIRVQGDVPVYGSGGITGYHDCALVQGPGVIIGRKGTVGAVYWEHRSFFPIDTTFYASVCDPSVSMEFVYKALCHLPLGEMNGDSAVPGLNRSAALDLEIKIPTSEMMDTFTRKARELLAQVEARRHETARLTELRNTLLPKLMSRELHVREAERRAEEVL
jgi:type I restriction enzyme S subunit